MGVAVETRVTDNLRVCVKYVWPDTAHELKVVSLGKSIYNE